MPKLLQIDSCLGIYSTGRITEGIAKAAMQRGWKCFIAHGARYVGKTIQQPYQITSKVDECLHFGFSALFDSHGMHSTKATIKLIRWIDDINPDIINLHCIHGYYLNYKVLFDYLCHKNVPVVWTFHDCWAFTGHCGYFVSINCDKWKMEGCHDCELIRSYPSSYIFDNSKRNFLLKRETFLSLKQLVILNVSNWLHNLVDESFFKDVPHRVIYNGVDTEIFHYRKSNKREELGLVGKKILLAAASAWSIYKGYKDYLQLSNLLSEEYVIVLVGLNNKQKERLPNNIVGLGRTNDAIELAELYSMADICLNLSYQETFGLTTVEAMACGTPGIVYDITASPELLSCDTGIVVPPWNMELLVQAIVTITNKGKSSYQTACRSRVLNYFDQNKKFQEYIELYEDLLKK